MKIKDLVGYTPGQLIAESYYESKMLKEEESDYYRDYQRGLISYEEYKDLVRQFQQRERDRDYERQSHDKGPWYIKIDGKIYKQKGIPKVFDWKKGANNYALAMIKNKPELQGKIKLTKNSEDNQGMAEGKTEKKEAPKPRNFVAKNAINSGAGAHKDKKKAAKQGDVKHKKQLELAETATAGATSAANIGTVDAPHISPGKARGKKSYIGSPGHSGTKAPPQPKIVQPKKSDGTAVNGLDIKGSSLFGGSNSKAKVIKRR